MLFNSYVFLLLFLPVTLIGFHLLGKGSNRSNAIAWLVGASLLYYGWWNPAYLGLILSTILINYLVGTRLRRTPSRAFLTFGLIANLGMLGYFKYANFFVDNLDRVTGVSIGLAPIVLPLAISFFTFQQIAYLVDAHRGQVEDQGFLRYCLFVSFFPQLIAGPIVHHKEMLPQFARKLELRSADLAVGFTILVAGLFKKVMVADNIATYSTPVFAAAEYGAELTFFEAWGGALAYTFQIYFDFSGYSDMAIGAGRMFGIVLPINFYSPYKASSIIEFWRRWHMTLSRFLRDYIYVPLGGSRRGNQRRYVNLMATMLLGGLWHGAGWNFVLWGALHGLFLCVNHLWNALTSARGTQPLVPPAAGRAATFACVVVAWVLFRAESFDGAVTMYRAMFLGNGLSMPGFLGALPALAHLSAYGLSFQGMFHNGVFSDWRFGVGMIALLLAFVWYAPNTLDYLRRERPVLGMEPPRESVLPRLHWRPTLTHATAVVLLGLISLMSIQVNSEFLYFQF